MEFCYGLESFHGSQRPVSIFLQLLIVRAIPIHSTLPFEYRGILHLLIIKFKEERPDQFSIDEGFKPLLSSNV